MTIISYTSSIREPKMMRHNSSLLLPWYLWFVPQLIRSKVFECSVFFWIFNLQIKIASSQYLAFGNFYILLVSANVFLPFCRIGKVASNHQLDQIEHIALFCSNFSICEKRNETLHYRKLHPLWECNSNHLFSSQCAMPHSLIHSQQQQKSKTLPDHSPKRICCFIPHMPVTLFSRYIRIIVNCCSIQCHFTWAFSDSLANG